MAFLSDQGFPQKTNIFSTTSSMPSPDTIYMLWYTKLITAPSFGAVKWKTKQPFGSANPPATWAADVPGRARRELRTATGCGVGPSFR
jgi:hypothetical protein